MSSSCQAAFEVAAKCQGPQKPVMAVSLCSLTLDIHLILNKQHTDVKDIFVWERVCESESTGQRENRREDISRDNALMISANVSAGPLRS